MQLNELSDNELNYISAYSDLWVKIKKKNYKNSLFVTKNQIFLLSKISINKILELIQQDSINYIIVASKDNKEQNNIEYYQDLINLQIAVEFMQLQSGLKTFNIILSEDRPVGMFIFL
ncbi:MAG: Mth938-like domain-containing protein [Nitrosomonadales bacterium]